MKHDVVLEGWGCRLRPVALEDAGFIIAVRSSDFASKFIHQTDTSIERQKEWLNRYFERKDDYYWIVEDLALKKQVGTYGLYDIVDNIGMPGRLILLPESTILPAVLTVLMWEFAFERLNLRSLYGFTRMNNKKIIRFAKLMGYNHVEYPPEVYGHYEKEMHYYWTEFNDEMWPVAKKRWQGILGDRYSVIR